MPGFGASDALIQRRSRRGLLAIATIAIPFVFIVLSLLTRDDTFDMLAATTGLAIAVFFFFLPAIAPEGIMTGQAQGKLRADRTGVVFEDKLVLPRERVGCAWIEERLDGTRRVHLSGPRARDDLTIFVEDDERAKALLEALDLRHDRHTSSFEVESAPLRSRSMQRLTKALIYFVGAALTSVVAYHAYATTALIGFLLVPVLVLYSFILRRLRLLSRIVIGVDGIVVRASGLLRQIPLGSIRSVTSTGKTMRREKIELMSGEKLDMPVAGKPLTIVELVDGETIALRFVGDGAADKSVAFAERLQESINRAKTRAEVYPVESQPIVSLLARANRSATEWLGDLRRLMSPPSQRSAQEVYRVCDVPDDQLWRIVEQPDVDSETRTAAIIALRVSERLDESGRTRIAEIAGATAHRDLRAALEAAANGESDERIIEAFEREAATPPKKVR